MIPLLDRQVLRVLALQGVLSLLASGIAALILGPRGALSILAGGLTALVSTLAYAVVALTGNVADPRIALRNQARGEASKIVVVIVLFVTLLSAGDVHVPMTLLGFFVGLAAYWLALLSN